MEFWRQGDVVITLAEMPKEATKEKTEVIAYGEVTGHAHRTHGNGAIFEHPATRRRFLKVLAGGLTISHEEHEDIDLPEGEYELKIQREFDWWNEEVRRVAD